MALFAKSVGWALDRWISAPETQSPSERQLSRDVIALRSYFLADFKRKAVHDIDHRNKGRKAARPIFFSAAGPVTSEAHLIPIPLRCAVFISGVDVCLDNRIMPAMVAPTPLTPLRVK